VHLPHFHLVTVEKKQNLYLLVGQHLKSRSVSNSIFSKHVNNAQLVNAFNEMHEEAKTLFLSNEGRK